MLAGLKVPDDDVRELARLVDEPTRSLLEKALGLGTVVVALTIDDRERILQSDLPLRGEETLNSGPICEECGEELVFDPYCSRSRRRFCSDKCRYRNKDRKRYAADPERERERSRRYYAANREKKLAYMAARNHALKGV